MLTQEELNKIMFCKTDYPSHPVPDDGALPECWVQIIDFDYLIEGEFCAIKFCFEGRFDTVIGIAGRSRDGEIRVIEKDGTSWWECESDDGDIEIYAIRNPISVQNVELKLDELF